MTLKNYLRPIVLILLVFSISCSSDDSPDSDACAELTCLNNGTCIDGVCECPEGFEGVNCEIDLCEDIVCENNGTCFNGACKCPEGFKGDNCEIEIDPCEDIVCENDGICESGSCNCPEGTYGEFCEVVSDLVFQTEFGSVETLDVKVSGIFAVWWNPKFDHKADAEKVIEYITKVRNDCLTELGMEDPPNPSAGYFFNIYIHHGDAEDVLPTFWGNGVGTDSFGMPYMTIPDGAVTFSNLSHEGFHVFQYNANSPGFAYSGDSQWYIESAAQFYMSLNVPNETGTYIEAGAISRNPQLALWHSFSNEAPGDAIDWYYQVRQYGMHTLLNYLTEEADVDPEIITGGFYAETDLSPQEYIYTEIGATSYRQYFADWSAHNTGGFDYLNEDQVEAAMNEADRAGDSSLKNPFVLELTDEEASGVFSPPAGLRPRGWSYNVIKINNSETISYTFDLDGDETGSEGATSHFEARVIAISTSGNVRYLTMNMDNDQSGSITLDAQSNETEIYLNVVSVAEHFSGNQTYDYEVTITRGE